jgi:gliding motility-associated-like protein
MRYLQKRAFYIVLLLTATVLKGFSQPGTSNIEFVENKGQWDPRVQFRGELPTGALFLEKKGFSTVLYNPDDLVRITEAHHGMAAGSTAGGPFHGANQKVVASATGTPSAGNQPADRLRAHAYRVSFTDASDDVTIVPDKILPGYNNYFIGNDRSKWASDCRVFQGVMYKNLYPNIDVRYYTNEGQLKYDIIVHPGGDVRRIRMKYDGADRLSVKKSQLVIGTSVGAVTQLAPYSYLYNQQGRTDIRCRYTIRDGNTVGFDVPGYDSLATLIIDPTVVFCSFSGSKVSNWGFTATPGPDGSFFLGGIVFGPAFPFTTGALEPTYGGGQFDVGLLKLNTSGSKKVYATYLGGNDSETPHSLICDGQGNLVVLGRTYSSNFPVTTSAGTLGGADMFVTRISAGGNALTGSMRIGGSRDDCVNMEDQARVHYEKADSLVRNYGDDSRSEVVLDGGGNILVAGSSQSVDFPITGPVFQPGFAGGRQDGVVLKIDPTCNRIIWSTFLGGTGADAAFVLKANPLTGDIYVGGATTSPDFPGVNKGGVIQNGYAGGSSDGYVAQLTADGTTLIRSTYLGTDVGEAIYGLQFDKKGFPYVMGTTNGTWPVMNVRYFIGGGRQFVSKLKPDLSGFVYSTTFGTQSGQRHGMPNISPVAFLIDRCENIYVSGWGGWIIGSETDPYGLAGTAGMPKTSDAYKPLSDNRDFYFIVMKKNADTILYGTFFGENDNSKSISEHVDGGTSRYDQNGVIYQGICANCSGPQLTGRYPTTPGVWAPVNGAGNNGCNMAGIKIAFNFAGVSGGLRVSVNGRIDDTAGCIPMDTYLEDTVRNAKQYIFNFGDGSPDTATTSYAVSHTYPNPGTYTVMMVAIDSNSCNVADTLYRHVIARTDKAPVSFAVVKDPNAPCTALDYDFTNTSVAPPNKPFGPKSFTWDFGDGSPQVTMGFGPVNYSYKAPGTYIVNLILDDTSYCNYPDTAKQMLRVSPTAKAQFVTPPTGCAPYTAVFNNTSLGGTGFTWNFGDPGSGEFNTSNEVNPVHVYQNPGTYTITLQEVDPNTCNKTSDTSFTITVSVRPKSAFTYAPSPPVANVPIVFTNGSQGGSKYLWLFGDGDSAVKTTADTVQHLYIATDSFPACLITTNEFGCTDTVCHSVQTLINPLVDVPNAFTPGRFGQNSILKVVGFGILHMDFRIYNRWGKLVFESDNPNVGWDGNYLGVPQPMDVYAYTLEAQFSDGKHATKKGDITLVR